MANYRFKTAEIEAMKKNILTHIECEAETKTAWRLRCAIEGQLMCCRPSKRDAARLERELALYEKLTKNDLPNWQSEPTQPATPTETPQIVRVEIVRDFDGSYYANLYDANGNGYSLSEEYTDFRTLKTLCKKEYGICLPNLSQIEFENHGRKSYAYTSTEKPQISTEAAETANVSAEGEKETERAENKPKRKIQYFHYTPEQLKRYIIDVYEKRANGEWVLLPYAQIDTDAGLWDVVDGKIGWWTNWRREEFSEMNMDFNSPTCGRCCKINRTYQTDNYVISNEKLLEFTFNGDYYYIQRQIYSKGGIKECYTIMDALGDFSVNDYSDTLEGIMRRFDKCYKGTATIIWQASETPTEPPQSSEIPQTVECATDAPKPRENAA